MKKRIIKPGKKKKKKILSKAYFLLDPVDEDGKTARIVGEGGLEVSGGLQGTLEKRLRSALQVGEYFFAQAMLPPLLAQDGAPVRQVKLGGLKGKLKSQS
jgi:hypothetical protein